MEELFEIDSFHDFQNELHEIFGGLLNKRGKPYKCQKTISAILELIASCNYDLNKISATCNSKGWSEEKVKCFINSLNLIKTDLLYSTLNNHNCSYGETIINFDWLTKYILGTSELKTCNYPLMQLLLSSVDSRRMGSKAVYDVDKEILLKLISVLDNIVEK